MRGHAGAAATIAAWLLLSADAQAQIGRVAGTITDEDGRPVKGATVVAENRDQAPSTFTSTSDARGRYSVLGLRRGSWLFTIQAPGFEPVAVRRDVVTNRPNPPLDVRLTREAAPAPRGPLEGLDAKEIQQRIDRAASLAASGDHRGAIAAYSELLQRVPALTTVYMEIGVLHERLHETDAARAAYRRLLELEPANPRAKAALGRLERP